MESFLKPRSLEGQVLVFIFPRKRVARLYPQALGSLFIDSYNSQGYGGGFLFRPTMGNDAPAVFLTNFFARTE
jgi:hypothetical protein